tara:strand:+ start:8 stop:772 length:765 start_codon:yes stop_codon:yes gene_type:complete
MVNVLHYILIPFKIILFVILIILGIYILKSTNNDGNITTLIIVFFKFVLHFLLSYNIEISDEDYNKYMRYLYSEEKFLCVFNHISILDGLILLSTFPKMGIVLYKQKFFDYIGYDDESNSKSGSIFVNGDKKSSVTTKIKETIYNREKGQSVLFISPDANTLPDKEDNISKFIKKGAFVSKSKIFPIIIKYEDYSIIYNPEHEGVLESFLKLFLFENYKIKIKVCDMINACENESIEEYKERVYHIMNEQYKDI